MSVFGAYAMEGSALRVRPAVVLIQPIPRTSEGYCITLLWAAYGVTLTMCSMRTLDEDRQHQGCVIKGENLWV